MPGILLLCSLCLPGFATAQERYAMIVSGASGGEKYAAQQGQWRSDLVQALEGDLEFAEANVIVLAEEGAGSSRATAANVRRRLTEMYRRMMREDMLLLVLLGHGTVDGTDAKFNLVGPDLTAGEWRELLDALPGRVVVVNTTALSSPFLQALSRRGRVVITATDSLSQRFATVFPEHFIRAIGDVSSDVDKNGRVSVWEAFEAASAGVRQHYEGRGQLSTERALLDDDGDGQGRESVAPGQDGPLARTIHLDPDPGSLSSDPAVVALVRQRNEIEARIEALKLKRGALSEQQYQAELEKLVVELARVAQEIRRRL